MLFVLFLVNLAMHVIHHVKYLPNISLRVLICVHKIDETTGTPLLEMKTSNVRSLSIILTRSRRKICSLVR